MLSAIGLRNQTGGRHIGACSKLFRLFTLTCYNFVMMPAGSSQRSTKVSFECSRIKHRLQQSFTGVRYKATVIWDLFWTPFDERFSEIVGRLKRHQQDFNSGLLNVYTEELMIHINAMNEERMRNSEQREMFTEQREASERKALG
jgi:hypothetical protein